jgi:hypothetical protein
MLRQPLMVIQMSLEAVVPFKAVRLKATVLLAVVGSACLLLRSLSWRLRQLSGSVPGSSLAQS